MTGSTVGCTARTRWVGAGSTGDATAAAARELRRMEEAVVAARAGLRRAAEATWVGRAGRSYRADLDEQQQR
ncbi:MAG: hypothetical protein H5T83_10295, partial [Actinotalea sp.]|nr:hypothetical protein [Actinotalea sp.]